MYMRQARSPHIILKYFNINVTSRDRLILVLQSNLKSISISTVLSVY